MKEKIKKALVFIWKNKKVIILSIIILLFAFIVIMKLHNYSVEKNNIIMGCELEIKYSPATHSYFVNELFKENDDHYIWFYEENPQEGVNSQWYKNKEDFIKLCSSRKEAYDCNSYTREFYINKETNTKTYFFMCIK